MGAMKAHYMDLVDLQDNARDDEESFQEFVLEQGWMSPTERDARKARAIRLVDELPVSHQLAVVRILKELGIDISPVDFPIENTATTLELAKSA